MDAKKWNPIDETAKCRPLIISKYQDSQSEQYLELTYNYTLKSIKSLQTYLCPTLQIVGVDFADQQEVPQNIKYKRVGIKGFNIQTKQILNILKFSQFQVLEWQVNLAIPLTAISKQGLDTNKNICQNLIMLSGQSKNPYMDTDKINISLLKKSSIGFVVTCSKKGIHKQKSLLINRMKTAIVLPKRQSYEVKKIMQIIAEDIANAANIMNTSKLNLRVLQKHQNFVLIHNFYQGLVQPDPEFDILAGKDKKKQKLSSSHTNSQNLLSQQGNLPLKSTQLFILIALVVGLVCGYIFFKTA